MSEDQFVIWTRFVTPAGVVIRHAYGPYSTRSKARTAKARLERNTELYLHWTNGTPAQEEIFVTRLIGDRR